ncbi:hypothetical protein V6N13_049932 [Hibiscus sabdariffa]
MAGEFCLAAASNAVGTLMIDYLVKPIERRIRYLFRFSKLVHDFAQQQNNLNREQTRVKQDVKEAEHQTQVIENYVNEWLTDAEKALTDAQRLNSRIEEDKRCLHWCPNWSWRYQLSKEIEKKTEDMSKLVKDCDFKRIGHRAELPRLEFFPSEGIVTCKSSTVAFNKIMEALKDENKETTKRCFLLCALYPEDHSIDAEDLVRYAWGLELYDKTYSVEEVRIQVLEAIDYLIDSCLLSKEEDEADDRGIGRYDT